MRTGFSAYTYCIMPTPSADTEETGRYDLAWKDLCSVLNALNGTNIEPSMLIISLLMIIFNHRKNSCFSKIFPYC